MVAVSATYREAQTLHIRLIRCAGAHRRQCVGLVGDTEPVPCVVVGLGGAFLVAQEVQVARHGAARHLERGFARVRCDHCKHEYLLAFSCIRLRPRLRRDNWRWFCPSCHQKKVQLFGALLTETLAHGAASWQHETPRYGLFYKYNDRAAVYHDQNNRRPSKRAFDQMTNAQKCFFNTAW